MGISYDEGGTLFDACDALRLYGIDYNNVALYKISWSKVKTNIDRRKPIIVCLTPIQSNCPNHAVTVCGYQGDEENSESIVKIWDSNLNNGKGGYAFFGFNQGVYIISGNNYFSWGGSVSYK